MIRVAIATLGCKTNAYESAAIAARFPQTEYILVPFDAAADIYIINTCTVTGRTDYKSRNLIRKALARKEKDPSIRIVATGCFAQRNPDEIRDLGDIDLIVDNQSKADIAAILNSGDYVFQDIMRSRDFAYRPVAKMVEHSRAFQKIQDGCDYRCAYCAVPYGRGSSRSAALSDVLEQARLFVQNGYREIVLGGVNLGLYQDGDHGLADVVEALQDIDNLELIRLSSIEPQLQLRTGLQDQPLFQALPAFPHRPPIRLRRRSQPHGAPLRHRHIWRANLNAGLRISRCRHRTGRDCRLPHRNGIRIPGHPGFHLRPGYRLHSRLHFFPPLGHSSLVTAQSNIQCGKEPAREPPYRSQRPQKATLHR